LYARRHVAVKGGTAYPYLTAELAETAEIITMVFPASFASSAVNQAATFVITS